MGVFGSLGNALGTIGRYYTTPEGLQTLGAGLKDISAGGSENMTDLRKMQMLQQQQAEQVRARAQQAAIGQKLAGLFGGQAAQSQPASVADMVSGTMNGQGGPSLEQVTHPQQQSGGVNLSDPATQQMLWQAQQSGLDVTPFIEIAKAGRGGQTSFIEGPDGIYQVGGGQPPLRVQAYPAKVDAAPVGYRWNGDKLEAVPGGPADPSVIGSNAGVRRKVVVANPLPQRAGHGGGGGKAAKPKPWERIY